MRITAENVYHANGFASRAAYLADLADNYGPNVYVLAGVLGPSEDFDGLVTELEDMDDYNESRFDDGNRADLLP